MALSRNRRDSSIIWPGFVDAVTTLLMVLIFVLTIFTVMQAVLREQITSQDNELNTLNDQMAALSDALGLERRRSTELEAQATSLSATLARAQAEGEAKASEIAALLLQRGQLETTLGEMTRAHERVMSEAEALELALAQTRQEVDAAAEAARLAAAQREVLELLLAKEQADLAGAKVKLDAAESAALADAAALEALRARLSGADTELAAMTLALEAERKRAEESLTLLAAQRLVSEQASAAGTALAVAEAALLAEKDKVLAAAREMELANQQLAQLRAQLGALRATLDATEASRDASNTQLQSLGRDLNAALAQVASEQRARAALEAAERARVEAEKKDLERFRSEFFGQLSALLAGREGVRVVGDRFVFSSEVLFRPGAADLAPEGENQIAGVVAILNEVRQDIPDTIDWIIRVDGHTDDLPLSGQGQFKDNWDLSAARAMSVVRFMQNELGFPPDRLAATGFGEYRPVVAGESEEARAQNRRIELKLTER